MSGDLQIINRVLQGEVECFAELIDRYHQHVTRIVNRHVPSDHVAEVAHDIFVRAFSGLAGFSTGVPFEHWLSGIAVRTCYDFWRARSREDMPVSAFTAQHEAWIDQVLADASDARFQEQVGRQETTDILRRALQRLSPENRLVLTLVHLEGHSVREAAQLLGWSVVNVKVRAHRARHALRRLLREKGDSIS